MRTDRPSEDGMVTAEAAAVLPSLVLLLAMGLTAVLTVGAQLKLVDAAREAARVAARGDSTAQATSAAERLGPDHMHVAVHEAGGTVSVDVTARVRPFGVLPGFTLHAHATAESEQRP